MGKFYQGLTELSARNTIMAGYYSFNVFICAVFFPNFENFALFSAELSSQKIINHDCILAD